MKRGSSFRSGLISLHHNMARSRRSRTAMRILATAVTFSGTHEVLGQAQNLWWDPNGSAAGAATALSFAAGTWNAANANWNNDSGGTATPIAWTPGGTANFSAGTNATG